MPHCYKPRDGNWQGFLTGPAPSLGKRDTKAQSQVTQRVGSHKLECIENWDIVNVWALELGGSPKGYGIISVCRVQSAHNVCPRGVKAVCDTQERDVGEIRAVSDI